MNTKKIKELCEAISKTADSIDNIGNDKGGLNDYLIEIDTYFDLLEKEIRE